MRRRDLLMRSRYQIYESIRDFTVAVDNDKVVGFGALHILGE
jgi:N-acetylglutamate synthase-like GNAT family acetyltransferase